MSKGLLVKFVILSSVFSLITGIVIYKPIYGKELTSSHSSKLTGDKLASCQSTTWISDKSLTHIPSRVQRVGLEYDDVVKKSEHYYVSNMLPSNKIVSNYVSLTNDIAKKKSILDSDSSTLSKSISSFSCSGDDPKSQLSSIKIQMQKVKDDISSYEDSIKNLISALKAADSKSTNS